MDRTARFIRDGYVEYLRSKNFDPYFRKLHRAPRWRYVFAVPMILSVVGAGIGLGLITSAWISGRKRNRIRQDLIDAAERSVPVMTYPVMANVALLRQKGAIAPALVIATFDADATTEEMADVVLKMDTVDYQDVSAQTRRTVAAMFSDVQYTPGRRRLVPEELTGGRRVYAFDLMMIGDYLPTDTFEIPLVPCVAEPGESGTIQMLPAGIVGWALEAEQCETT
jgi:hypothetical protein